MIHIFQLLIPYTNILEDSLCDHESKVTVSEIGLVYLSAGSKQNN